MSVLEKLSRSNFSIKLKHWEYWPFGIVQFPLMLYFAWLSLRARSILFFSASNPGIPMGGMFGESKYEILSKVPRAYVPNTAFVKAGASKDDVLKHLRENGFQFPVIFKPDLGERGFMVKRIHTENDVDHYLARMKFDFMIQELVDLPLEFGVFYTRFPNEETGRVTSVVKKEMLTVTGDGKRTLQQLILAKDRAKLQWETLQEVYRNRLTEVLGAGQVLELVSIGNHCLGTKFLDGNSLITPQLSASFDRISKQIDGFYFGRFDLRCASPDDLYAGRVKIMELNGCGAEPAHIYQPGYSLRKALGVLFTHWRNIFIIARENSKRGARYTTWREGLIYYRKFKAATQST
ncbi:hypothetical protein [Chryseolinea lacunae]|uniref:D-alanine--D-alanine ligase n=1 Tax=Chryseolinea lacunae TaxID=2801331 RepID=A0ABS1KQY0_9BACT|nr:hypothetical protein [Chryseolinea lacunae]MBL0741870.1 hypothetical protein [Chryseolinea lacunae]